MRTHGIKTRREQVCYDFFVLRTSLCRRQVGIGIYGHQRRGPAGPMADGHDDIFYG